MPRRSRPRRCRRTRLAHGYRLQDGEWLEEAQLPDGAFGADGRDAHLDQRPRALGGLHARRVARRATARRRDRCAAPRCARCSRSRATTARRRSRDRDRRGDAQRGRLRLRARRPADLPLSASRSSHTGGLPGFGSLMRWLPEHGVGIVALGNLTYTGWGGVDRAGARGCWRGPAGWCRARRSRRPVLARAAGAGDAAGRRRWDDALADSVAAMNLVPRRVEGAAPRGDRARAARGRRRVPHRGAARGGERAARPLADAVRDGRPARRDHARADGAREGAVPRGSADRREESLAPPAVCR